MSAKGQVQDDEFESWMNMGQGDSGAVVLTKAIASQIVRSSGTILHKSADYVPQAHEVLTPEKLAEYKGRWTWLECTQRWDSLPGETQGLSLQAMVDRRIVESRVASVSLTSVAPCLNFITPDGSNKKVGISEGLPLVSERGDQYGAYKVASLYLLANPPPTKGEAMPKPLEPNADGFLSPKTIALMREWHPVKAIYTGPFEAIYGVGMTPTVSQIETAFQRLEPQKSMQLQSKTLSVLAPAYTAAYPHSKVVVQHPTKPGVYIIGKPKVAMTGKMACDGYWKLFSRSMVLGRVKSVYEPYFGCLLSPGLAKKVHIWGNLQWCLRQVGCVGVVGNSESSVWTEIKSVAALNIPIWTRTSITPLPFNAEGVYSPGEYTFFPRALEIIDVTGMRMPAVKAGVVSMSPIDLLGNLEAMYKSMAASKHNFELCPVGFVAYYDARLEFQDAWVPLPLDMSTGKVLLVRGLKNPFETRTAVFRLIERFLMGKIMYPYVRVPWPALCPEIATKPVILRNGKEMVAKMIENYMTVVADGEPIPFQELADLYYGAKYERVGPADVKMVAAAPVPVPQPVVLPPEVVKEVPKQADHGYTAAKDDDEYDPFMNGFEITALTPEAEAELQEQQRKYDQEAFGKKAPLFDPAPQPKPQPAPVPEKKAAPAPSGQSPSQVTQVKQPAQGQLPESSMKNAVPKKPAPAQPSITSTTATTTKGKGQPQKK